MKGIMDYGLKPREVRGRYDAANDSLVVNWRREDGLLRGNEYFFGEGADLPAVAAKLKADLSALKAAGYVPVWLG
jgi:hypothetical protein